MKATGEAIAASRIDRVPLMQAFALKDPRLQLVIRWISLKTAKRRREARKSTSASRLDKSSDHGCHRHHLFMSFIYNVSGGETRSL
jgi:hypothetical protein